MEQQAMYKLTYGLYLVSTKDGGRDNGCITNTAMQITATEKPEIVISISKANLTHDMVLKSRVFQLSAISEAATFSLFERFGYHSGRDTDKFAGFDGAYRDPASGCMALNADLASATFACRVTETMDFPTHTLFRATVDEAYVLSDNVPCTYAYYQASIKPRPAAKTSDKPLWRCTVCGYEYEGEELPPDYICPICKHPASDFERVN